jgi:steroid delta-isomerase-like uncharacterized protein
MSNKPISQQFFEVYGIQHDVEGCSPLFATDTVIHFNNIPGPLNFDGYKQLGYSFLAGFSNLKATVLDQIEEGSKVVSRVAWSGTHSGEFNGIPATGRSYQTEDITIDHIVDGKIQERWVVGDLLGMMQQLGVIPVPGQ